MNKFALAKACIITWKRQMIGIPIDKDININPSWLKVDKATIFLESVSIKAANLATKRVSIPKNPHKKILNKDECPKRIINQTPAVTKVELCTKDLTGVGAAIAAGNHLTNGHCALFVKVKMTIKLIKLIDLLIEISPSFKKKVKVKTTKKIESPKRLVNKVSRPPFDLDQFW